jgi:hypothetical protein
MLTNKPRANYTRDVLRDVSVFSGSSLSLSLSDITVTRQLGGVSLQYEQVIGN